MLASPPQFPRVPCETVVGGLPFPRPMATLIPDLGDTDELCQEMTTNLENMSYLTNCLNNWEFSSTFTDMMTFGRMRSTLEYRLCVLQIRKPPPDMTALDYQLEACRLAALIFLQLVYHNFKPFCSTLRTSKEQLMELVTEGEERGFGPMDLQLPRGSLRWALFMGGLLSLNAEEETWFAVRIATSMKMLHGQSRKTWADMEEYLKAVSWSDRLKTPECMSLWDRIQTIYE